MKRGFLHILAATALAFSLLLMQGCGLTGQNDKEAFQTIKVEEAAPLDAASTTSPTCQLSIDYQYPVAQGETDSITPLINEAVQRRLLGDDYAQLSPASAIDSFKNDYIRRYRTDVFEFYREDLDKGTTPENMPQWYNYSMSLTTRFAEQENVLNLAAETMVYTGGAHPNTWGLWLNFNKTDGSLMTLDNVFTKECLTAIIPFLTEKLIAEMAIRLEDESIRTVDDLKERGILTSTDMYVSENFLIEEDGLAFLYNRYDIAPYALGAIELRLSYTEIEHIINLSF